MERMIYIYIYILESWGCPSGGLDSFINAFKDVPDACEYVKIPRNTGHNDLN